MSNAIRYDSLLLAAVARSLDARLRGRAVRGAWLDRVGRTLLIRFAATVRKGPDTFLHWQLHPSAGDLTLSEEPHDMSGSTVQVAPGTALAGVHTLPDERILVIELDAHDAAAGFARRIVVELIGTRWNAIALGDRDVIMSLLQTRERGAMVLRPGATWQPPQQRVRAGRDAALSAAELGTILRDGMADAEDVRKVLIAGVAFTSPMNATYICTPVVAGLDDERVRLAHERYASLLASDEGFVLPEGRGQPYPGALDMQGAEHAGTLLDAFARVALRAVTPGGDAALGHAAPGSAEAAMAGVHERIRRLDEKLGRLEAEHAGARADAERLRHIAGLLLAQLHRVARGATQVELDAFDGTTVPVELNPGITAQENATRWYDQAKRRELAAERVPALLQRGARERAQLEELQRRLGAGEATADEIARWSQEVTRTRPNESSAPLPYRTYRTTGGLELRVGRNSRANDQLTFHHSSPEDIWLHARDLAGAHVILRWSDRNANPPARDLAEAAAIAAVNSRGRTSGMVAVDWTRRKHVRKPRKAPAGRVVMERAKTIFAEPDAKLDRRLRTDEDPV